MRLFFMSLIVSILCVGEPPAFSAQVAATVRQLPKPRGKYGIGRIAYHWVDGSRMEQFSKVPGKHRELMVTYGIRLTIGRNQLNILSTCREPIPLRTARTAKRCWTSGEILGVCCGRIKS